MAEHDHNPRAVVGGNHTAFDDAVATFDFVGFLLARHETLMRAALDDKVDRACLRVLCVLIATMNRDTRTSWAGREYISQQLGMTAKTVSNYIYQLKQLGYLVSERRATPMASGRVLMHYTLSKLKPAEIEEAIERAISSIRGERNPVVQFQSPREVATESSCQDGNSLPPPTGTHIESSSPNRNSRSQVPARTGTQNGGVPAPTGSEKRSVPVTAGTVAESSCQDGHSNIKTLTTKNRTSGERGVGREVARTKATRLPIDWKLDDHREWGRWATDNFDVRPSAVRKEGEKFHDFWIAKAGKDGAKANWFATWRNWIRRAFEGKERQVAGDVTDLLLLEPEIESEHDRQLAMIKQQRLKNGLV